MKQICGTRKSWHYDYTGGAGKRVGMCRDAKVMYAFINPYAFLDDFTPHGMARFDDDGDKCTEWRER